MSNSYTSSVINMRVWQALSLVLSANVWIGLGRTSIWGTPDKPPEIDPLATELNEFLAFKKAETLALVVPDNEGEIEHLGQNWRTVSPVDARAENARHVYISAWLKYDELPVVTYRQTGVFVDVVLKETTPPGRLILLPNEVQDIGYLLALNNRTPVERAADQKELVEFIIEF